jgi:hypothetical protein
MTSLILVSLLSITCGGSSHNNTVSQAQAQAISTELLGAMNSAMVAGLGPADLTKAERPASLGQNIERAHSASSCTVTNSGKSCNIPISYQGPCPNGGTISVNGDFVYTLDNSGNGKDSSTLTLTPSECVVDNLTLNGNPNVMFAMSFQLQNDALAYPLTFSGVGGISFGPSPSGSCSINVKATVTSATSCSVSGSICGRTVNGNC